MNPEGKRGHCSFGCCRKSLREMMGRKGGCVGLWVLLLLLVVLLSFSTTTSALIVNTTITQCSRTCESEDCADPVVLRYGKYCGVGYTGCANEAPCDGLDLCCMTHDHCIGSSLANYVNRTCNENLRNCVTTFKNSKAATFLNANCSATDVENVIIVSMDVVTASLGLSPPKVIDLQWIALSVPVLVMILLSGHYTSVG